MKRIAAGIITCGLLGVVLWYARGQPSGATRGAATPIDCIDRMFAAAARGDLAAYVACFTGEERDHIERRLRQAKSSAVEESLRSTVADLKSWVVLYPPSSLDGLMECSLSVELVYASRVDRQKLDLRRDGEGWKIRLTHNPEPYQPPIPYGTPVSDVDEQAANK